MQTRPSIHRILTLTGTAAIAAAAVGFAPAPVAAPAPDGAGAARIGLIAADGAPVRTIDGLADRFGLLPGESPRDLAAQVRADRRIVEAAGYDTFAAADRCFNESLLPTDDCEEPVPMPGDEGDWSWSYSSSSAIGDVDGDGHDDLARLTEGFDGEEYFAAGTIHSGADGTTLWTMDDAFGFVVPVGDVDGDGGEDLVSFGYGSFTIMHGGSCTPVRCTFGADFTLSQSIRVLSGATGSELDARALGLSFQESYEYSDQEVGPLYASQDSFTVTVTDDMLAFGFVDHDGDGVASLLLGSASYEESFDGAIVSSGSDGSWDDVFGYRRVTEMEARTELIDLRDGSTTIVADTDSDGDVAFVTAVELDGRDVLLVDRISTASSDQLTGCILSDTVSTYECDTMDSPFAAAPTMSRELLASDLTPVWSMEIGALSMFAYAAGGDLDGDGADDLLDARYDEDTFDERTGVISGATGALITELAIAGGVAVEGALLAVSFDEEYSYDEETQTESGSATAIVQRVDVPTGDVTATVQTGSVTWSYGGDVEEQGFLWLELLPLVSRVDVLTVAEQMTLELVDEYEYCEVWEDEDGTTYEECWTEFWYDVVESSASATGNDGRDLAQIMQLDLTESYLIDAVDLDGDGAAELLVAEFVELEDESGTYYDVVVSAERLDGSRMWSLGGGMWVSGFMASPSGTNVLLDQWSTGDTVIVHGVTATELLRITG